MPAMLCSKPSELSQSLHESAASPAVVTEVHPVDSDSWVLETVLLHLIKKVMLSLTNM